MVLNCSVFDGAVSYLMVLLVGPTNGVAQGGILSPRFFNVYIDDLSIALSNSKYGCPFGRCSVNHLSYADDMVILSPSATALQKLLDICSVYSEKHDIVYYYLYNAFITRHTYGLKTCSEALTNIQYRIV